MAEFYVHYRYQSREDGSWSSTSSYVKTQDEHPDADDLINLIRGKDRRQFGVRLIDAENRASKKVEFYVRYHYTRVNSSSRSSSSTYVKWHDDNPRISDIQALVLGYDYNYAEVQIDDFRKR